MIWNKMAKLAILLMRKIIHRSLSPSPYLYAPLGKLQMHDLNLKMGPCTIGDCLNLDESEIALG